MYPIGFPLISLHQITMLNVFARSLGRNTHECDERNLINSINEFNRINVYFKTLNCSETKCNWFRDNARVS